MDITIQRKPGQLWLAPKIDEDDDDEELYVLIRETSGPWIRKTWEVLRFRRKFDDQMFSNWAEDVMGNDELVLDAQ